MLLIVAILSISLPTQHIGLSGFPNNRVFGSGTVLDSARFRYLLSEHLTVDTESIHAFIIGEHGDSELAVWSGANVAGIPIHDFCEFRGHYQHTDAMEAIYKRVKDSAYEIIDRKGATYYGIAMAVGHITESIIRNKSSILPVSSLLTGQYGLNDLYLSIPTIVNRNGAEQALEISLSGPEHLALKKSAKTLQEVIASLDL